MTEIPILYGYEELSVEMLTECCKILFELANINGIAGKRLSCLKLNFKPANPSDPLDNPYFQFRCEINELEEDEKKIWINPMTGLPLTVAQERFPKLSDEVV
jgi:hypothetical protein